MPVDPLVITEQSGPVYQSEPVNNVNMKFTPAEMFFNWMMIYAYPNDFQNTVSFPDYAILPEYTGHTDWKLNVVMSHFYYYFFSETASIPFCKIEGDYDYEGNLGILTDGLYSKVLHFSFANLNLLSQGQYFAKAKTTVSAVNPETGMRETISEKTLNIELKAVTYNAITPLEVSYEGKAYNPDQTLTPLVFNYHTGGALPSGKNLFYFSVGSYTGANLIAPTILNISDPLVTTTYTGVNSHFSKLLVQLGAGISALAVGTYDYEIQLGFLGFGNPDVSIVVPVRLNVLPESTGDLEISPDELNFEVTIGGPAAALQSFYVFSDNPWNVVSELPSWLQLSRYNGTSTESVQASIVNYSGLTPGTYSHELAVSDGTDTVTATITLVVSPFMVHPFVPTKLFFTKELDFIVVTSGNSGTYLALEIEIKVFKLANFEPVIYNRTYNLALLNGDGKFHVGSIVHTLLEEIQTLDEVLPFTDINFVTPNYLPAEVTISYEEQEYVESLEPPTLTTGAIAMFKMIKGFSPYITENNLCLLSVAQQDTVRITKQSIISCPFVHFGTPRIIVKRNNIAIDDFTLVSFPGQSGSAKVLYTYFRFINDLRVGDLVEIFIINGSEIRTSRYLVFPDGLETTHVLFENSNGVVESYEFTGRRRTPIAYEFTKKKEFKNLFEVEKKVTTNILQNVIVNTGKLEANDHRIINEIIKSEAVWLGMNSSDNFVKVDSITSKIITEDTMIVDDGYDIEFNILENSHDSIYPR